MQGSRTQIATACSTRCPSSAPATSPWNYVTLGLGRPRGATFWADFVYTLRSVGSDGTVNIEHEDTLVNSVEGVGRAADLLRAGSRPGRSP